MTEPASKPKPVSPEREGPRPLPLHLSLLAGTWLSLRAALPAWRNGSLPWKAALRPAAEALGARLAQRDPLALGNAIDAIAKADYERFLAGVNAYRRHPYRRNVTDPPAVWREGTTRLLDYGPAGGRPLLVIPSLVNRAFVLDLRQGRSLMRHLAAAGFRPFLVDWDSPGETERSFDLTAYIAGRLQRILDWVIAKAGGPIGVIGYCMGGNLALALTQRRLKDVAALALLATPWDFHAGVPERALQMHAMAGAVEGQLDLMGVMPVDSLQAMFALLDPYRVPGKYQSFAGLDSGTERAVDFVALEDWLNDGVPLAAPVARECLFGWYVDNRPGRGTWLVDNRPVRPEEVAVPILAMVPAQDYIVPPQSALPLVGALPKVKHHMVEAGHIGMVAGRTAPEILYGPLTAWLEGVLPPCHDRGGVL